jgi:hypothetical protein
MGERDVEILLQAAQAAIEGGEALGTQFLIPDGDRRWRVVCHDLDAVGQNDLGIPPKVFAHGAVGALLQALDAHECYVAEAASLPTPAVVVTAFRTGRLEVGVHPYATGAGGQVSWGEPALTSTRQPGALGAALPLWRAVNRQRSPMPPPDQLIEDMVDSGFMVMLEGGNGGG